MKREGITWILCTLTVLCSRPTKGQDAHTPPHTSSGVSGPIPETPAPPRAAVPSRPPTHFEAWYQYVNANRENRDVFSLENRSREGMTNYMVFVRDYMKHMVINFSASQISICCGRSAFPAKKVLHEAVTCPTSSYPFWNVPYSHQLQEFANSTLTRCCVRSAPPPPAKSKSKDWFWQGVVHSGHCQK